MAVLVTQLWPPNSLAVCAGVCGHVSRLAGGLFQHRAHLVRLPLRLLAGTPGGGAQTSVLRCG